MFKARRTCRCFFAILIFLVCPVEVWARAYPSETPLTLELLIGDIISKMSVPSDQVGNWEISIVPTLHDSKLVSLSHNNLKISGGAYTFIGNEDELAALVAQEMSYRNSGSTQTVGAEFLKDNAIFRRMSHGDQQRTRIFLATTYRLVMGGYNPWVVFSLPTDGYPRWSSWLVRSFTGPNSAQKDVLKAYNVFLQQGIDLSESINGFRPICWHLLK